MLKRVLILFFLFGIAVNVQSQKLYSKWPYGDNSGVNLNTTSYFEILPGGDTSYTVPSKVRFQITVASICDTSGNMLFYTNGISIFGADHNIIPNGDSINFGTSWNSLQFKGYSVPQSVQIIPRPNTVNEYFVIHQAHAYDDSGNLFPKNLLYTIVKLDSTNKPFVSFKNIVVFDKFHELINLVKHGNGNDYWLFVAEAQTNTYDYFLVDSSGIHSDHSQTLLKSKLDPCLTYGSPAISPNGKYFLRFQHGCNLGIYEFDRWHGKINKEIWIPFDTVLSFGAGSAFSPDSRKVYISSKTSIYQIDLDQLPIKLVEVAHMGNYQGALPFGLMDLASNGKIYINSRGPYNYMHAIGDPDSSGIKCNIKKEAIKLTSNINLTMPRTPNPYLGKLDTTTQTEIVSPDELSFRVYPNPNTGIITIEINDKQINVKNLEIDLLDLLGRVVYHTKLSKSDSPKTLDISSVANGIYCIILKGDHKILASRKLVINN